MWTLEAFAALANEMRAAQVAFYRERRHASGEAHHDLLMHALDLERRVDQALEEILARPPLFDRPGDDS